MAKLNTPNTPKAALSDLDFVVQKIKAKSKTINREVPKWVRNFFHEQTLNETLFLISEFFKKRHYFNIGCLFQEFSTTKGLAFFHFQQAT